MLANIDNWQISKHESNRKLREAAYVIPPQPSESETENESDSEYNVPLAKVYKNTDRKGKRLKMKTIFL